MHASLALHVLSQTELDFDEIYAALKQTVTMLKYEQASKIQFQMLSQSYVAKTDSL